MKLYGIRVLDFSQHIPGPFASSRLIGYGAEVIKVEPLGGDPMRMEDAAGGLGEIMRNAFKAYNSGKKSISLNLKSTAGRELAMELAKHADVLIESFRPGVMSRLGLGYEQVREINDRIIYCSLSGYGQASAISHLGSHDLNFMSLSGMLSQFTAPQGAPVHPTVTLADLIGGLAASEQILVALVEQAVIGKGQYLDISILNEMVKLMEGHAQIAEGTGQERGIPVLAGSIVCYAIYETKDGKHVSLAAMESKFWENFCVSIGKENWISAQFSRTKPDNPIFQEIKELFAERTLEEWRRFGEETDCCLTPVLTVKEISNQRLMRALPPRTGEHTTEILRDWLGFDRNRIEQLGGEGVIFGA